MAKNDKKKTNKFFTVENAVDTVSFINTVALTSTEKAFDKGFDVVEKLQSFTDKVLKKGFKFSAKQHDAMFDALDDTKEKAVKTYNKVSKRLNKKAA